MKCCYVLLALLLMCGVGLRSGSAEEEKVRRAREYDFNIMYRGKRPIPRDQMIPLTEDGVRSYGGDKNITVIDTTVERLPGCFQLLCDGDVTLDNVTVLEAGDFSYDLSSGDKKGLTNSTVTNYTKARLILNERVRNCVLKSVGPVEDHGKQNTIIKIEPETTADRKRVDRDRSEIKAVVKDERIVVTVGGKLFTCYKFGKEQKYPYFWPVNGPVSGKSITTETSQPYPHHHSLFFGCDRVNGGNYWQDVNERGQIVSQGPKLVKSSGDSVVFTETCLWRQPGKEPVIRDTRRITITAPGAKVRIIDFAVTLEPLVDIQILKNNHSLFSARVVPQLSVKSGGTLINAQGLTGEKGTWGVASPWCDYSGTRDGVTEGIAILQHPGNRWYPAKWFTRDYGFFSPTPMYWLEGNRLDIGKGEKLTLNYRVVVHAGDAKEADIKGAFESYRKTK